MKAIRVERFGEPEVLNWSRCPTCEISAGEILVQIKPPESIPLTLTFAREPTLENRLFPTRQELMVRDDSGVWVDDGDLKSGDRVFLSGSFGNIRRSCRLYA